jgi:predicted GTPase
MPPILVPFSLTTFPFLKKVCAIMNLKVKAGVSYRNEQKNKITKIVITGGPCAGKSTALSRIEQMENYTL